MTEQATHGVEDQVEDTKHRTSETTEKTSQTSRWQDIRKWLTEEVDNLPRPHNERQPSAIEMRQYSERGIWTTELDSPKRSVHLAYMKFFAGPVMVLCDYIKHIVSRPERFGLVMLVAAFLVVGTVLFFWV